LRISSKILEAKGMTLLGGLAKPAKVGRDAQKSLLQSLDERPPHPAIERVPVEQEKRLPRSGDPGMYRAARTAETEDFNPFAPHHAPLHSKKIIRIEFSFPLPAGPDYTPSSLLGVETRPFVAAPLFPIRPGPDQA
jgi:hypothetical protein